jgi:hypothetical protein
MNSIEVKWCKIAEEDHKKERRVYAHTFHRKNTICVCRDFGELPDQHFVAILAHEIGHLLAGPKRSENAVNKEVYKKFGVRIIYLQTPYGDNLEYVNKNDAYYLFQKLIPFLSPIALRYLGSY